METSLNTPYIKKFDNNGQLINPIKDRYINPGENRRDRRAHKNEKRFVGNTKGAHLTVIKDTKYYRTVQLIECKTFNKGIIGYYLKRIYHYILAN